MKHYHMIVSSYCFVNFPVNRSLSQSFTPSNKPRTARVVARKGGSSGTDVHTPNKNSPSVVMAGGGSTGNISSITVAQVSSNRMLCYVMCHCTPFN